MAAQEPRGGRVDPFRGPEGEWQPWPGTEAVEPFGVSVEVVRPEGGSGGLLGVRVVGDREVGYEAFAALNNAWVRKGLKWEDVGLRERVRKTRFFGIGMWEAAWALDFGSAEAAARALEVATGAGD